MKIEYRPKNFGVARLEKIEVANEIIEEYREMGYDLTLRQLYYQFVARDIIENSQRSYNTLGTLINDARLAGMIDWERIVDRTRVLKSNPHWDSPSDIISTCASQFKYDLREGQPVYIEAWIEKEALAGVLESACLPLDIPHFSCRGYVSQSAMWRASQRIMSNVGMSRECIIIHLGDHDPSGIDMTRDINDRLELFGVPQNRLRVDRIALNMSQVEDYSPPPNPAKVTDSRAKEYIANYGEQSWELDALDPRTITKLITRTVEGNTDMELFEAQQLKQSEARQEIGLIAKNYSDVINGLL